MTMEHVRDPKDITLDAYDLLSNGGAVAFVVHDRRSLVNRILGKKISNNRFRTLTNFF